jgi:hypothetical protein
VGEVAGEVDVLVGDEVDEGVMLCDYAKCISDIMDKSSNDAVSLLSV